MFKHLRNISLLVMAVGIGSPAWGYDSAMAESYAQLFAPVKGPEAGKALHMMKPDAFVNMVTARESPAVLDVRTPAEMDVFSATVPGSLRIPLNVLFTRANLERIPTDKIVVVLCKSGARATAAGTALRHIGFENTYVLKGGFKALIAYLGPKEANRPPAAK